jgi:hypothetical protein
LLLVCCLENSIDLNRQKKILFIPIKARYYLIHNCFIIMSDSNSTAEQPPNIEPVSDGLPRDEEGKYFPPMYEAAEGEIPPLKSASTPEKLVKSMHV